VSDLAHPPTNRAAAVALAILCAGLVLPSARAQSSKNSGQTVRHIRIVEQTELPELSQAETAIEKKDYPAAEQLLAAAAKKDEKNYRIWFDFGFIHNIRGRNDEAIAAYRKCVALKPDVFEANLNLGLLLARSHAADAEQFLQAATKLKPQNHPEENLARAWFALGHVVEETKPDDALAAYREANRLQPSVDSLLSIGQLLDQKKDYDGAEKAYRDAQQLDPANTDAVVGLANIHMRSKHFSEAETELRKLVAAKPDDAVLHIQLGRVLATNGKSEDAIAELQAGLKLAPDDRATTRDLADLCSAAKKYDEAEPLYRELLSAQPNDAETHAALGKSLLAQRKFPEAQEELLAAVKLKPGLGPAYGDLAVAANENKNYELAIRALDARAKLLPELPMGYFLRATAFDHLRDYKNAALQYHQFLAVAEGKYPDQEWQAKHRLIAIEPKK